MISEAAVEWGNRDSGGSQKAKSNPEPVRGGVTKVRCLRVNFSAISVLPACIEFQGAAH